MNKSASIRTVSPRKSEEFIKSAFMKTIGNALKTTGGYFRGGQAGAPIRSSMGLVPSAVKYNPALARERKLLIGGGLGLAGLTNTIGNVSGYEKGNESGYRSGVDAGLGQGYNLAAAQVQNTPFLSRLMGRYQFDPSQIQGLQKGILSDPTHRLDTRQGYRWW